jgi:serpin B
VHRRTFLTLLTVPAIAAVVEACGSDDDSATADETRSSLPRASAGAHLAPPAAMAVNDFGTALYRRLAAERRSENLVMSPASIAVALTMASAGARGETLAQMLGALRIDDGSTIHRSMNALTSALQERDTDDVTLSIANSLWGQSGTPFEVPFLDVLAQEYGAAMNTVDYIGDVEASRQAINDWVDVATAQRIPELLAPGVLSVDSRLTVVNAIHLKAPWLAPFTPDATIDAPFSIEDATAVSVPTMHTTASMGFASGDGWKAVEMPYAGGELAMLIFLPEDGFLDQFEEIFLTTDATQYLENRQVALALPRFDIESNVELADVLIAMGMVLAFGADADFSGITTAERLNISNVVHQANITVDEDGTEAAAATAVVAVATSAPSPESIIEFKVDRPFVFALRDRATGALLFLGRVSDPRG